ncbi:N-acetylglucosamine-6-phosphate deacetylase [Rathayibacter soli]|uniref:N-acetylglucosamine-6-phosphate deacetylase n=1 Tax=Rathayibacter soli TaxID=3144168 RepID=UPI0027E436A0|nr:N-acetylglucosamine-6-phosphate deacetylase [Glaciibacter superstes]
MNHRTLIHSARLVTDGRVRERGWVLFDGDTIAAVGDGDYPESIADAATARVNAAGRWLTPGFVDIHCHGGGGASFDGGPEAISTALRVHRAHGTTRTVLSLVTAELSDLQQQLAGIVVATVADPLILGAHLEGPFLDAGHKGAHDATLLRLPTPAAVELLLEAAGGRLCQVTIAPERAGGMAAIEQFAASGVAVAVGHTAADYETARAAFDAGASILTHAFNAMEGIHHRAPGPVVAATAAGGVTLEVINDGVHVHPQVVRLVFAAAPDRVALVTDAMAAAGASDGEYLLGGLSVTVAEGVARLTHGTSIAGSTLTQDTALQLAVRTAGVNIETAVDALTRAPAHAIGRSADLGRLAPGYAADAVLLGEALTVDTVWAAGNRIVAA